MARKRGLGSSLLVIARPWLVTAGRGNWAGTRIARYKLPTVLHLVDALPRNAAKWVGVPQSTLLRALTCTGGHRLIWMHSRGGRVGLGVAGGLAGLGL